MSDNSTIQPSEVLDRAADLISPEGAWVHVMQSHPWHPGARAWSMEDAVIRESGPFGSRGAFVRAAKALDYIRRVTRAIRLNEWVGVYGRAQAEVVAALRQAAELARSEGR